MSPGISFSDCYFVDFKTGWVVGSTGGRVRKTTDGGITWISQDIPGAGELFSVFFLNSTIGWVGSRGTIFKTSDGGSSWTALPRLDQGSVYGDGRGVTGLFFTDESNGLYTAAEQLNGGLYSTSNGGETWYRVAQGAYQGGFLSLTGVAGGAAFTTQGNVFNDRTTVRYKNGGVTDVFQNKTLEFISNSADEPSILMATRLDDLFISSDGGMNWSAMTHQINGGIVSDFARWGGLGKLSATSAIALRWNSKSSAEIVETADGGQTWLVRAKPSISSNFTTFIPQPRFFAFDVKSAWQAYSDNTRLLRIGEP